MTIDVELLDGSALFRFPYDEALNNLMRSYGASWLDDAECWELPENVAEEALRTLEQRGHQIEI